MNCDCRRGGHVDDVVHGVGGEVGRAVKQRINQRISPLHVRQVRVSQVVRVKRSIKVSDRSDSFFGNRVDQVQVPGKVSRISSAQVNQVT